MTQQEYEQKKQECWDALWDERTTLPISHEPLSQEEIFNYAFDRAYALGKQERDAEGEEMLTVSAITVREMYAANERIKTDTPNKELGRISDHINHVLRCLFGSKCLPDACNVASNVTSNVASNEPKPAEPKFKVGDCVLVTQKIGDKEKAKIVYYDSSDNSYRVEFENEKAIGSLWFCLLYTSDAADE